MKEKVGSGRVGEDPGRCDSSLLQNLFDEAAGFLDRGHVTPDSVGFPVAGPVETDHPIPGPGQEPGSPIVAADMVTKTVEKENRPFVAIRRMPLAEVNIL